MPPRTTLQDRGRLARIREREARQLRMKLRQIDNITDEQIDALKKIKAAEVKGKPVKATSVGGWEALHKMGVVREEDGNLILSSMGTTIVNAESN